MKIRYEDGRVPQNADLLRRDIATQMRTTRKQLHLTQQALADRAGTKKSNISRMESGRYNPSLDFLVKVADSMGKRIDIHME